MTQASSVIYLTIWTDGESYIIDFIIAAGCLSALSYEDRMSRTVKANSFKETYPQKENRWFFHPFVSSRVWARKQRKRNKLVGAGDRRIKYKQNRKILGNPAWEKGISLSEGAEEEGTHLKKRSVKVLTKTSKVALIFFFNWRSEFFFCI